MNDDGDDDDDYYIFDGKNEDEKEDKIEEEDGGKYSNVIIRFHQISILSFYCVLDNHPAIQLAVIYLSMHPSSSTHHHHRQTDRPKRSLDRLTVQSIAQSVVCH